MRVPKKPTAKVKRPALKVKLNVDPTRLSLAALERIRTVLVRKGQLDRLAPPTTMRELAARATYLGLPLPPSYSATMRTHSAIGDPEQFLSAAEMKGAFDDVVGRVSKPDIERYAPFCRVADHRFACFDRGAPPEDGELAVVEWNNGTVRPRARNFGEWLDGIADAREEAIEHAASLPVTLRELLHGLGFTFEDPIIGRLETGDVAAMTELMGEGRAHEVRGEVDRLFDSSGKASLTLNVDEFTMAVALRTGIFMLPAEDVFRWLRYFRDENFFGEPSRAPSHPDQVRDLRRAPREPPLILRGVLEISVLPARKHHFRAAGGLSADDFYLLGRTSSTSERSPSVLVHVLNGNVKSAVSVEEPLTHLHVTADGTIWGLSHGGAAVRMSGGVARTFPLERKSRGRTWWYGIGGGGDRVLVWGAGAVLEFDGEKFVPFSPDAQLDDHEAVVALSGSKRELAMLVCGDHVGAVARFDGRRWLPISEDQVIEGQLVDLDSWRGVGIVLGRTGDVWRIEEGQKPRPVIWDNRQQAFVDENEKPRLTHGVRGFDGGALLASDGGVISVGAGDPVFHAAPGTKEPARLARVGPVEIGKGLEVPGRASSVRPGLVAMCGPHAWLWRKDAFYVIDLREW